MPSLWRICTASGLAFAIVGAVLLLPGDLTHGNDLRLGGSSVLAGALLLTLGWRTRLRMGQG